MFPLRIKEKKSNDITYPSWDDYIKEFFNEGWTIRQIIFLGNKPPSQVEAQIKTNIKNIKFYNIKENDPANKIASQIRADWGWL
ncbi:hypothetical protein [Clostridium kluyveri]|uniref:Uncharacterized protein n=1 Tax=Clostridium kluyveri TaxID=1534 RepID=A0A1L5FB32_CLOKL|nr:hypothetical protein [Clostridium kluyveri]APM40187.1 hypothetical protein BS101_16275 [Clostridium kluyveri]